jgi:PAS domain S-box-containing protein
MSSTKVYSEKLEANTRNVTLQLVWKHQFQFAGYYAAIAKGYYKAAGIKVNLKEPTSESSPSQVVIDGKAEFGICSSDILLMRAKQQRAVVLATIFQHSPLIMIASKQSGIDHIHDLVGKKIDLEPNAADIIAYMQDEGVLLKNCEIARHKFDITCLLSGKIDATSAYSTDEPFLLKKANFDYTILNPRMNGIDFYGDILFTTQDLIERDPILVKNFRNASIKGWHYAMDHPEEIIQLIYTKYSKRHSIDHLRFEAHEMKKLIMEDVVELGYTNPKRWESIAETYKKLNMLSPTFTIDGLLYSDYKHQLTNIPWDLIFLFLIITIAISSIAFSFYRYSRKLKKEIKYRHETENELMKSEEHYRMLFENNPSAMVVIEPDTKISMVNLSYTQMTGYSQEDVIGLSWTQNIHPDDLPRLLAYNKERLIDATNAPNKYEFMYYHKDGTLKLGLLSIMMLEHKQKIIASFIDISKRKIAEAKQRESEQMLKTVFENSPTAFVIFDKNAILTACNSRLSELFGMDTDILIDTYCLKDDPALNKESFWEDLQNGNTITYELIVDYTNFKFKSANPGIGYLKLTVTPISTEISEEIGYIMQVIDITEQKKYETALQESEVQIRAITNSAQDAIIMINNKGLITFWNPAAEKILGYTNAEATNKNVHDLITPIRFLEVQKLAFPHFQQSGEGNAIGKTLELSALTKSGEEIPIELSLSSVKIKGEWCAVGVIRDITERKQNEEKLRESERLLHSFEKDKEVYELKSRFVATASHEFRTPLATILLANDVMLNYWDRLEKPQIQEKLEKIKANVLHLTAIVNDVLQISTIQEGKMEFNPKDVDFIALLQ